MTQLYDKFTFEDLPLQKIFLDYQNPRIVTQKPLSKQTDIIEYLFQNEDLSGFIHRIVKQGKNPGAEQPYVVKQGSDFVVIEGNTRIAAYKLLCGIETAPADHEDDVPKITDDFKNRLLVVRCSVAPSRDAMMPIMAHAHFGTGDKSKWGYLGSRQAVFAEYKKKKSIQQIAKTFEKTPTEIVDYLLEYLLYQEALGLPFTESERGILLAPSVEFNPPVRFLQTFGHKEKVGISYDRVNVKIDFKDAEAKSKFRHLIYKLVISQNKNRGTDAYDTVFADYSTPASQSTQTSAGSPGQASPQAAANPSQTTSSPTTSTSSQNLPAAAGGANLKTGALFSYNVKKSNQLLVALMREAKTLNGNKFPAASTFLLRNIVETLLKEIIHVASLNPQNLELTLGPCLDICIQQGSKAGLSPTDVKVLKEFKKHHLAYLNLGAHGSVIPSYSRTIDVRNTIDQFVKSHI